MAIEINLKKIGIITLIIIGMVITIFSIYFMVSDSQKNMIANYNSAWDSCNYFVDTSYQIATNNDLSDCYSPYAYIIIKEDGRFGNYCFIKPNSTRYSGTIYGVCNWENKSINSKVTTSELTEFAKW